MYKEQKNTVVAGSCVGTGGLSQAGGHYEQVQIPDSAGTKPSGLHQKAEDDSDTDTDVATQSQQQMVPKTLLDSPQSPPCSSVSDDSDEDTYFVEKILACKVIRGTKHYKIKWQGHKDTTWEPASHIPEELIRTFHVQKTNRGRVRRTKKEKK